MSGKFIFVGVVILVTMSLFGMAAMIQRDQGLDSIRSTSPLQKVMNGSNLSKPSK